MNKIMHPIEPEELMAYLDGELPMDRATATAAHLGECAECQSLVSKLREVSQSLKGWNVQPSDLETRPSIEVTLAGWQGGRARAKLPMWRNILARRWFKPALAGAFAVALLATGLVMRSSFYEIDSRALETFSSTRETSPAIAPPPASQGLRASSTPRDRDKVSYSVDDLLTAAQQDNAIDRLQGFTKLQKPPAVKFGANSAEASVPTTNGPMIIRTAQLSLITKEFEKARAAIEAALKRHRGYVGELKVGGATGSGRTLTATLRVPADQLDAALAELKTLGRVESESQSGEDVTTQYVDLQARLANARNTSQRLTELLQNRTGKLSDVLEVEQELDRVRGEIEQMEAERKNMTNQVSFATLNATITEDYKAQLQVVPPSTWTRLSNAAVEGYRSVVEGVLSVALFLLTTGPSLLLWGAIFFFPARFVWKKLRGGVVS
jgi:hypothetical protein